MDEVKVNPNLEFRKVKSLYFLYEVSEDGRFLRNVKSKKYKRIFFDKYEKCYVCNLLIKGKEKRVYIKDIVEECFGNCDEKVHVIIRNQYISIYFDSMAKATKYISEFLHRSFNSVHSKMKKRRKNIYGYDITYLNAETGHAGLTRQGTVQ